MMDPLTLKTSSSSDDGTTSSSQKPVLAVFDFDGTLTVKDSFMPFVKASCSKKEVRWGIFKQRRALALYFLGRCSNHFIKETLVSQYFKGKSVEALTPAAIAYAEGQLNELLNPVAMERLCWHQHQGHRILLVSANLELYLKPWAAQHGIGEVIGTKLTLEKGKITGKLDGKSCYGLEKVTRLEATVGDLSHYYIYAYGDSGGDRELLEVADEPFYRSFSSKKGIMIR